MSWRTVKLGEIVEYFSVRAKEIDDYSDLVFCGVSNQDGITVSKYAAEDKIEDYKIIEKGCFAYNPYRVNVGSIALLNEDRKGLISPAYVVFKTKPETIIDELLLKFLKSKEGLRQIKLHARGTVRQALRFEDLCEIELSIPDFEEQQTLFGKLDTQQKFANNLTTELDHQLALVKELRQAYLREAMQGKLVRQDERDEPAEILLEKIKAEKEKLVAEKRIKKDKPLPSIGAEEIPFEIPSNWTWCRLGECSINRDGERIPISLPERQRRKKIYDYYGASGVIDKIDNFTHDGRFLLIGEDGANLVARSTPVAFIAAGKFWVNNHAHVIETVNKITTDYLCNYINGISLKPYITGGFQPKLSQGNLNLIIIPLPPLAEQERIVAKLEKLMKFCNELETNINTARANADQLLQTALKEALEPKDRLLVEENVVEV
jgi:type I restriction enzyme, S subunit